MNRSHGEGSQVSSISCLYRLSNATLVSLLCTRLTTAEVYGAVSSATTSAASAALGREWVESRLQEARHRSGTHEGALSSSETADLLRDAELWRFGHANFSVDGGASLSLTHPYCPGLSPFISSSKLTPLRPPTFSLPFCSSPTTLFKFLQKSKMFHASFNPSHMDISMK